MTPPHTTIGHGAATKAAGIHARPGPPRRHPLSPSALAARADPATIHRPGVEAVVQP
ncbi:hypothetical protein M3B92_05365 [Brevibacterium casei]|uniref:hypothetical protein n=1 Tax=Brevibacterium casei TaxID=33889 RepID=UPI00223BDB16|nr:hypothetical protein [Brevibacterium casei]MCT1765540.1 hypothetical protein [Brevibacterium casei]